MDTLNEYSYLLFILRFIKLLSLLKQDTTVKPIVLLGTGHFWDFGQFSFYNLSSFRQVERKSPKHTHLFYTLSICICRFHVQYIYF